jgi:membrane protein
MVASTVLGFIPAAVRLPGFNRMIENTKGPPAKAMARMTKTRTLLVAIYRLYEHSQLSMAGAVAFSFVVSLFPFCILMASLAGIIFGGRDLAQSAVEHLFEILPADVAKALAPQVEEIITKSRIDLMTIGGAVTLFFATSAVETLRAALNFAYRVRETRPYILCLILSMLHVFVTAGVLLALSWTLLVAPGLATVFKSELLTSFLNWSLIQKGLLYGLSLLVISFELFTLHIWLAAGKRTIRQAAPGVALTLILWAVLATLYSYYLGFSNYTRFYAGLSQLMIALIFFQLTAVIIILGAELNRGVSELRRQSKNNRDEAPPDANQAAA